jgi:phage tail-like protein
MPQSKNTIKTSYPLPAYNYRVTIYGSEFISGAGGATTLGFSEVNGLNVDYEHEIYRHGLSFLSGVSVIRGKANPLQVTMKRGIIRNDAKDFFYKWLSSEDKFLFLKSLTKDMTIDLCDEAGVALVRWLVKGAVPIKMEMPTFSASDNEAAIESLQIVAHSLKVNYSL